MYEVIVVESSHDVLRKEGDQIIKLLLDSWADQIEAGGSRKERTRHALACQKKGFKD